MHLFAVGFHAEAARRAPGPPTSVLRQAARGRLVGGTFAGSLADGPDDAVTARPIQGGYVVRGRRPFCSLAPCLDLCFCSAQVVAGDDPDPSVPVGAAPEVIAFWLPRRTRGLWFDDTWDTLGMRGTGSFDVVLDDVVVPAGLAAPMPPRDAAWSAEAEQAQAWFTLTISAVYLGLAEEAAAVAIGAAGGRVGRAPGARRLVGEIGARAGHGVGPAGGRAGTPSSRSLGPSRPGPGQVRRDPGRRRGRIPMPGPGRGADPCPDAWSSNATFVTSRRVGSIRRPTSGPSS